MTASRPAPLCVLGAGLIGGSLLRAAAAAGWEAFGYNRSEISARADGFDVGTDLPAVLRRAAAEDALVVLAVPMPALDAVLAQVAAHAPGCALTDVVSVKAPVAAAVRAHGLAARFVGGHPMAGTAESGWAATDAALFRGAAWAVTVDDGTDPAVWRRVARLALDCGSRVVPVTAAEHDAAVARISHLPHVLAEALAQAGAGGGALALGLAAGSFRDGTRVAGTAPDLVRAICEPNAEALRAVLDETLAVLTAARRALDDGSLAALAEAGHAARRRYEEQRPETIAGVVPGAPGWLEELRAAGRRGAILTAID